MNERQLEKIEKYSIHSIVVNHDLKDQAINSYLNDLNKIVKANLKKKRLAVFVMEIK